MNGEQNPLIPQSLNPSIPQSAYLQIQAKFR